MKPAQVEVEADLNVPGARVQLLHSQYVEPPEETHHVDKGFRLELCLNSRHRTARANYRDFWGPNRFEKVGALYIVPPDLDVVTKSDEIDAQRTIACQLDAEAILQMFDVLPPATDPLLMASLDIRDPNIIGLLHRLAAEAKHPGFASEVLVESMTTQLSVELFRSGATVMEQSGPGGLALWRLKRIDERLREIGPSPTLEELAGLCHMSIRQLTRAFRATKGCTLGTYAARIQLEHAKYLLQIGERVNDVAAKLGFSSSSNFCYAFKRAMGITPGEFQTGQVRADVMSPDLHH